MNEKIISKIKKLLALSKSENEHESQNAMLKVQEMLMKHKLSLKDVEECDLEPITTEEKATGFTFTKAKWKGILGKIIGDNLSCYTYFRGYRSYQVVFFGKDDDVTIAEITYKYAIDCINSEVKKLRRQAYKEYGSAVGIENDYALGFISGLKEKFDEQKAKHQEWGLVLSKPKEVVEQYEEKSKRFSKKGLTLKTQYHGNSDAYYKGEKDGKEFDISNKVAYEGENETILID